MNLGITEITSNQKSCDSRHDHDLHHQHHHEYRQYQPSLLEATHLKADLARPTLLQQPPIKYEDDRDYRDIDESNHCIVVTMMIIVMIS